MLIPEHGDIIELLRSAPIGVVSFVGVLKNLLDITVARKMLLLEARL